MENNSEKFLGTPEIFKAFLVHLDKERTLLNAYKKAVCPKDEHLNDFKLIILDVHLRLEKSLNNAIFFKYIKGSLTESDYDFFDEEILSRISFREKISIVRKMNLLTNDLEDKALKINTLRNQLVHLTRKLPIYKKVDVKKDKSIINEIFIDFVTISQYIFKKAEELGIFPKPS